MRRVNLTPFSTLFLFIPFARFDRLPPLSHWGMSHDSVYRFTFWAWNPGGFCSCYMDVENVSIHRDFPQLILGCSDRWLVWVGVNSRQTRNGACGWGDCGPNDWVPTNSQNRKIVNVVKSTVSIWNLNVLFSERRILESGNSPNIFDSTWVVSWDDFSFTILPSFSIAYSL